MKKTKLFCDFDNSIKPYKPLPARSKFRKSNKQGQIPYKCVHFTFSKKHCWIDGTEYETDATDCKVLKGEFCDKYMSSEL